MAMHVIVKMAEVSGAERLIEISTAHIDSCLYHGPAGLDFAQRLVAGGGLVCVPTTLNVSALDLLHPELIRLDPETRTQAGLLMDAYVALGCAPTWTCAPYQLPDRPAFGQHVAWAESNAIVFANSVLGARTGRYGDFVDICAALTGRVPLSGLHTDDGRRARIAFLIEEQLATRLADQPPTEEVYGLVGHVVGRRAGSVVPAIVGLPAFASEDDLKALGAAAASSGSVALCHVVGVTPEAGTLDEACGGAAPGEVLTITTADLDAAWDELTTASTGAELAAVSVGTPHFSSAEFDRLETLLDSRAARVPMYVSTGRDILAAIEATGLAALLRNSGVTLVTDTCTYITPILDGRRTGAVMTNSAKWAWYAPANMDVEVVYGGLADCVESAVAGRVVRGRPSYLDR